MMNITFIGTGYVGLVSGVMMAHIGHKVTCLDIDENKIETLKKGKTPIFEEGLQEYINQYGNSDRLQFILGYTEEIKNSDCVFITVGTPPKENGDADLSIVFKSVESALEHVREDCVFVLKSTVPPGTCSQVQKFITEKGYKNQVVSNPEFLREGTAVYDFLNPDRIIVGAEDSVAEKVMRAIYKPMTDQNIPLVVTNLATSELIKYAANSFLANKIAFINEMANLCEIIGADVKTLAHGMGLDNRIGSAFLNAGPGFGGSCFPKDLLALDHLAKKLDANCTVLGSIIESNDDRSEIMLTKIINSADGSVQGKKITIFGLTYKANTDDLRSSPAIGIINSLKEHGAKITAYDPEGMVNADNYFEDLTCANSAFEAAKNADAAVIITEWDEFKNMDLNLLQSKMKSPILVDLRNIINPDTAEKAGFKYYSVGRKSD